jgi:MarR family transcriptional regulator, organic hydroperoxide resistance regulator
MRNDTTPLITLIKRCTRLIDRAVDNVLKEHNIARSQYRVLHFVDRYGKPTQTEIIEAMEIQASTLSLIVDVLVRKEWLVRTRDSDDRRIIKVSFTPEGKKNFQQIPDPTRKIRQTITQILNAEELQRLELSLKKIINELS